MSETLRSSRLIFAFLAACLTVLSSPNRAGAVLYRYPESIPAEALSDTIPFTFSPNSMNLDDFEPYVASGNATGVTLRLETESFEWVRVGDVLMVPRASLAVSATGHLRGLVDVMDFSKTMVRGDDGVLRLSVPVALLTPTSGNRIRIRLFGDSGVTQEIDVGIRHRAQTSDASHGVGVDSSCSPYGVQLEDLKLAANQWVYVGCRYVLGGGESYPVPELELFVLWDGANRKTTVDGMDVPEVRPGLRTVRRSSSPDHVLYADADGNSFRIDYRIPSRFRSASVGFGLGPYSYSFVGEDVDHSAVAPLLTLYGSYYLSEPNRLVMFNATSFQRSYFSDTGVYFQTEQFTVLDRRLTMRILLGLHALVFPSYRGTEVMFSGPQGAELIFRDFGLRAHNLSVGAFIYPLINDRSYYNIWVRWGTARFFGEFNYISWQESLPRSIYGTESIGISVGGPLFSFL